MGNTVSYEEFCEKMTRRILAAQEEGAMSVSIYFNKPDSKKIINGRSIIYHSKIKPKQDNLDRFISTYSNSSMVFFGSKLGERLYVKFEGLPVEAFINKELIKISTLPSGPGISTNSPESIAPPNNLFTEHPVPLRQPQNPLIPPDTQVGYPTDASDHDMTFPIGVQFARPAIKTLPGPT